MGRLTGCCGCFDLRDGCIAIGILYMIWNMIAVIGLVLVGTVGFESLEALINGDQQVYQQNGIDQQMQENIQKAGKIGESVMIGVMVTASIVVIVTIVIDSLLIHGARTENRCCILPWLIWRGIGYTISTIATVVSFILLCTINAPALPIIMQLICGGASVALCWYWFAVVHAHYKNLRDSDKPFHMQKLTEEM